MKRKKVQPIPKGKFGFQLYAGGMSLNSMEAIEHVKRPCSENLQAAFEWGIIDLYKKNQAAGEQQILFNSSIIKTLTLPGKILFGDFTDTLKAILGLGITIK